MKRSKHALSLSTLAVLLAAGGPAPLPARAGEPGPALRVRAASPSEIEAMGLRTAGALAVEAISPEGSFGLRAGDILAYAGDKPIARPADLVDAVEAAQGKPIELLVYRDGLPSVVSAAIPPAAIASLLPGWLGVASRTLPTKEGTEVQVLWVEAGSPVEGRLQPGDILVRVDQTPLTRVQQLAELVAAKRAGDALQFEVRRKKKLQSVAAALGRARTGTPGTLIVAGMFQGQGYRGQFMAYLDPNRRVAVGAIKGSGLGSVEGTFQGAWSPDSDSVQWPFQGKVRLLVPLGIQGTISGHMERSGRGSGTFVGTGAVGQEQGSWQCEALVSTDVAAF